MPFYPDNILSIERAAPKSLLEYTTDELKLEKLKILRQAFGVSEL